MASPTRPAPPPVPPAAAVSRRPFYTRWWYDPVQRRRVIIATVLALLYGSGLAYRSWTRGCATQRCPSIHPSDPHNRDKIQLQESQEYGAHGPLNTQPGIQRPPLLPPQPIPV